jgi:hypothetical protein
MVQAAVGALAVCCVGVAVRGPHADRDITKDMMVGAMVVGGAWACDWAARELGKGGAS